jgi:hypothetical protein
MHAFTGDNATSNDKQTAELEKKDNSFDLANHIRCFNHTIQLSAKALVKPFTTCISSVTSDDNKMPVLEEINDEETDDDADAEVGSIEEEEMAGDDMDDGVDELEELSEDECTKILEETAAVKETITKVSNVKLY